MPPHLKIWSKRLATLFGVGFAPFAPGTAASLVSLPFAFLIQKFCGAPWLFAAMIVASIVGVWACELYARQTGNEDPSEAVIDELAGQWLACSFAPLSLAGYATAFVLFRFFDMTKIWPVSAAERARGGWGIMLDDIVAGLIAGVIVLLLHHWKVI
jgi:phosphatidylglycerophosphatase A